MAHNLMHGKPAAREKFDERMKRKTIMQAAARLQEAS